MRVNTRFEIVTIYNLVKLQKVVRYFCTIYASSIEGRDRIPISISRRDNFAPTQQKMKTLQVVAAFFAVTHSGLSFPLALDSALEPKVQINCHNYFPPAQVLGCTDLPPGIYPPQARQTTKSSRPSARTLGIGE